MAVSATYKEQIPSDWELVPEDIRFPALKRLRILSGITAAELAEISGVNRRQIQRIELGESEAGNLAAKNLLALAVALNAAPRDLMD